LVTLYWEAWKKGHDKLRGFLEGANEGMKKLRKIIGWYFIISGYVGCAVVLIYGVFSAIGRVFDWKVFLLGLLLALLMYAGGFCLKEGKSAWKVDKEELERLRAKDRETNK